MSQTKPSANRPEASFHALLRTFGLLRQVMDPYFAQFGISGPQWAILRVLQRAEAQNEAGLRLKDLGQRLLIRPPSVTGVVDRLERLGHLQRGESSQDMRVKLVRLTPQGRKLVQRILKGHGEKITALFEGFAPEELDSLLDLLTRFQTNLGRLSPRQPECPSFPSIANF